ncbi:class I adenylate-forming enzyme family protein [Streptomyces sp. NPDC056161]|uniref:class I adenylate-forming enzyme family protein n=1 Tax=Streptomyces sp. NPDC056161 TaxID=3345732 RepID=UPI0035E2E979
MDGRNQGERICHDSPDQPAIIQAADGRSLTYRQVDTAMESAAALVRERIEPGRSVGILGENSAAWIIAFYAVQRAGGVPVPISHRLPAQGMSFVADDADLAFAFADVAHRELLERQGVETIPLELLHELTPRPFPSHRPRGDELAMILYTSGSTGQPKGVELTQAGHLWVIDQSIVDNPGAHSRTLVSAPLYHMNALTNTQRLLASGGTIVLLPRFEPGAFLTAVERYRVSNLSGVPPMFAMLARHSGLRSRLDLTSVRRIAMASAPAAPALFRQLGAWFPGAEITFGYGTTESGPIVFRGHPDGRPTPRGSVGTAHPAVDVRLVGADGRPVTGRGVLEVRTPALMKGYRKRPDIVPPVTADGFHHTNDIFRVDDDGFYFFEGREDDVFSTGGENVYPRAVESVLEAHPAVAQAVVVGVPDEARGSKPVAFVTLSGAADATEDDLKRHVLAHLEPFAHPRRVWIVTDIPLSPTNKPDRARLTADALDRLGTAADGIPPRDGRPLPNPLPHPPSRPGAER